MLDQRWIEVRDDPRLFIRRLMIQDNVLRPRELGTFLFEQDPWVNALLDVDRTRVLGIKPRQVGWTTATLAYLFWKLYTSSRARRCLQVVNEDSVVTRLKRMTGVFHDGLPDELRSRLSVTNKWITEFGHNNAAFQRVLAGGAGQGRGDTYTDLHATEMSKWKAGTAAVSGQAGLTADEEMFGSAISAIHDPTASIIVESTGAGPRGLFHKLFLEASGARIRDADGPISSREWNLVFISWLEVPRYQLALTDRELRELERDVDQDERNLQRLGATLQQIAWRRDRMRVLQMTPLMFKREFPTIVTDPFQLLERGWLDATRLAAMMLRYVEVKQASEDGKLVVFERYEPGRDYYFGVDTAGGVGADEACIQGFKEDGTHVFTWASRWANERATALMVSRCGGLYSGGGKHPKALIEGNKYGQKVAQLVREYGGVDLWLRDDGELWWTDENTKRELMLLLRELIDEGWIACAEFETVRQLQQLVEKALGKIEAKDGEHDDRAMAAALGLWCGRRVWKRDTMAPDTVAAKIRTIRDRFDDPKELLR